MSVVHTEHCARTYWQHCKMSAPFLLSQTTTEIRRKSGWIYFDNLFLYVKAVCNFKYWSTVIIVLLFLYAVRFIVRLDIFCIWNANDDDDDDDDCISGVVITLSLAFVRHFKASREVDFFHYYIGVLPWWTNFLPTGITCGDHLDISIGSLNPRFWNVFHYKNCVPCPHLCFVVEVACLTLLG